MPLTLSVVPALLVTAGGQRFALPMHAVAGIVGPGGGERWAGGRPVVMSDGAPVPVTGLAAALGLPETGTVPSRQPVVLLTGHVDRHGFRVDGVLGRRPVVVKGLSRVLPRLPVVVGASVEPDGPILLMLDSVALVERALGAAPDAPAPVRPAAPTAPASAPRVLVVDDAVIVREVERSILEQAGYEVEAAGDGLEAMSLLAERPCDLVVSDIDMPRMNGLELTARIRATPRFAQLPVILVTARGDEESRRRGLEAGADGYVVKSRFDREALLGLVQTALGER
ncbi:MAG: response regulator [Chloroflexi bacterium]|nr:MAG: response regulator [Chloroflexota bacterium]